MTPSPNRLRSPLIAILIATLAGALLCTLGLILVAFFTWKSSDPTKGLFLLSKIPLFLGSFLAGLLSWLLPEEKRLYPLLLSGGFYLLLVTLLSLGFGSGGFRIGNFLWQALGIVLSVALGGFLASRAGRGRSGGGKAKRRAAQMRRHYR